jgi:hypothetical protein
MGVGSRGEEQDQGHILQVARQGLEGEREHVEDDEYARPLQRGGELRGEDIPVAEDGVVPWQTGVGDFLGEPARVEDGMFRPVRRDPLHPRLEVALLQGAEALPAPEQDA